MHVARQARMQKKKKILYTKQELSLIHIWVGEKFQSNPEIAGSPRNSFRASLVLVLSLIHIYSGLASFHFARRYFGNR